MQTQSHSSKFKDDQNNNHQSFDRSTRQKIINSQDQNQIVNAEDDPDPDDSDLETVEDGNEQQDEWVDEDVDIEEESEPGKSDDDSGQKKRKGAKTKV